MYKRFSFAGVPVPEPGVRPPAYDELLERHGRTDIGGFDQLIQSLEEQFSIAERPALYGSNTESGVLPANQYKVLVNPAWESLDADDIPGDREDAVWNIPKNRYTTVTHDEPLRQLREAIVERYDGDSVFGTCRLRREGAEMHTDIFMADNLMSGLDGDELYLGISTGHDYTSSTRLYVDVVGLLIPEGGTARVLRYLIDPRKRKHTGDAEDRVISWYGKALDRLDTVGSRLYRVIGDSMHHEIDMGEYPCSVMQWYAHLGLPSNRNDLAGPASRYLTRITPTDSQPTAWHFYKAGMKAIEDTYDSRDTSAYKNHVSTVNTILFNPSLAEKRVLSSVEKSIVEARASDDDTEPSDVTEWSEEPVDDPLETVRTRATAISEGVAEFESTKERVRALLEDDGTEESVSPDDEPLTRVEADD